MPRWLGLGGGVSAKVASSVASLGNGTSDGQLGLIRVGTWPDQHEVLLRWNAGASKWVSEPIELISTQDQMGCHQRGLPDYITWQRFQEAIPYIKAAATTLNGNITLPLATITVVSTTNFAASGAFKLRNQVVAYTGKTATTFTGCTGGSGSYVTDEVVTQGDTNGWGLNARPLLGAGALWSAGLRLQENLSGGMNGNGTQALDLAAYWYQFDAGENTAYADPPSGSAGLGFTSILTGPTSRFVGVLVERPFQWKSSGWVAWPASRAVTDGVTNSTTTITSATASFTSADVGKLVTGSGIPAGATIVSVTNGTTAVLSVAASATASGVSLTFGISSVSKSHLIPMLYGRMNGGAGTVTDPGEIVDNVLRVRWIG